MKDVEPNRHFSDWWRGLGSTSTTRLTLCEVAQHDTPMGAVWHFVVSLAAGELKAKVPYFSTKSKADQKAKLKSANLPLERGESTKGGAKRPAQQMKCDNVTPVKSDRKLLPSSRLV